jgi:hypothetical protein
MARIRFAAARHGAAPVLVGAVAERAVAATVVSLARAPDFRSTAVSAPVTLLSRGAPARAAPRRNGPIASKLFLVFAEDFLGIFKFFLGISKLFFGGFVEFQGLAREKRKKQLASWEAFQLQSRHDRARPGHPRRREIGTP